MRRHIAAAMVMLMVGIAAHAQSPTTTPAQNEVLPLQTGEKVDVNTATQTDLERLPGIGPKLAQAIVTHRETVGAFVLPADLMRVPGIREGRYAQVKPWITADVEGTMLYSTGQQPKQRPKR